MLHFTNDSLLGNLTLLNRIQSLVSMYFTLKDLPNFKLNNASKHPFLNLAIHFIVLDPISKSNYRIL
jgi:hypothetical protein